MEVFEIVIALLLGGAVLAAISLQLRRAEGNGGNETEAEDAEVIRAAMAAERRRLIELRDDGTIGDAAFQQIEQELDVRELDLLEVVLPEPRYSG